MKKSAPIVDILRAARVRLRARSRHACAYAGAGQHPSRSGSLSHAHKALHRRREGDTMTCKTARRQRETTQHADDLPPPLLSAAAGARQSGTRLGRDERLCGGKSYQGQCLWRMCVLHLVWGRFCGSGVVLRCVGCQARSV